MVYNLEAEDYTSVTAKYNRTEAPISMDEAIKETIEVGGPQS